MKKYQIFANHKKAPIAQGKSDGGEILKHQIASQILLHFDDVEDITKLRVIIEDIKED